jgi:hypothetical protein
LLARENEALLVGRNSLFVLTLLLHVVDRVGTSIGSNSASVRL